VGAFYVRNILTRRAVVKVVRIFRQYNAVGIEGAKTLHELGLERPNFIRKATNPRDYKQHALQILLKEGIVRVIADGKVFMAEDHPIKT
jgi:hypothetical protein